MLNGKLKLKTFPVVILYRRGTIKYISCKTVSCCIMEAVVIAYPKTKYWEGTFPVHVKPHSVRHVAMFTFCF